LKASANAKGKDSKASKLRQRNATKKTSQPTNPATIPLTQAMQKPPATNIAMGVMVSFFLSGILHEYLQWQVFSEKENSRLEQFAFFMIQGILCVGQGIFQRSTGFGRKWGNNILGNFVGWIVTVALMLFTGPLFIGPYCRSGKLYRD
jgi:hypothetical protein